MKRCLPNGMNFKKQFIRHNLKKNELFYFQQEMNNTICEIFVKYFSDSQLNTIDCSFTDDETVVSGMTEVTLANFLLY
ncbi:hypothetical protein T4D_1206 [Trichinella pseudospiralis]|uniref:Uncharacterized protein n=1 Tax=Trichinella pseudospiralis TaxID=6337 RepID=A0A0V1FZY8_TRIPS|nr:hypothetical protein T4D_1206 [Trichinella pseudospiralis]